MVIQSSDHGADYLDERIESFIESIHTLLAELSDEHFEEYRSSVVASWLEKCKTLDEETDLHWRRIEDGSLDFERTALVVQAMEVLTKNDIIDFYETHIRAGAPRRAKFSSQV